ncbi:DUF3108 domain-containing protein [Pelomonas sp. SE-A7]|uniref:DUF3108 domain-containing protein n=1 Tax=Pelomonas sp. SE-A7 TaxID=3054953 RepID=UPI00259CFCC7|nr:DUF3108 domain-containing protein [Pelomonas sp. SE-A7]MDM4768243.1 DUF3108 domain-containing protein [Pelomonas sp. SE-A7]
MSTIVHMPRVLSLTLAPTPPRRWLMALAAALALHGLLGWSLLRTRPLPLSVAEPGRLQVASVRLAAPPAVQSEDKPAPAPGPITRPNAPPAAEPVLAAPTPRPAEGFSWRYQLLQGGKQGSARLSWQPLEAGYELVLERELEGRALPAWRSLGELDASGGLAPRRFAQRLRERDRQATNFRRDEGLVSFSASPALRPLLPGSQDRISWWLQLAALVDAEPRRYAAGTELLMPVAGLRGELPNWRFVVRGAERLELPAGVVEGALHLERDPLGSWDGRIEVWLDPARHHLPVRVRHSVGEVVRWELLLSQPLHAIE